MDPYKTEMEQLFITCKLELSFSFINTYICYCKDDKLVHMLRRHNNGVLYICMYKVIEMAIAFLIYCTKRGIKF